ncbi:heme transporter HemC [Rhizobiales bacterium RZME27]|uniref:Heme exporter protein C n=1 Tax=Endobacterium cereale TaxID=2663029 RepID=A0A6A8AB20_9HYPH|nr:heme ABC transporter permease [Endobacterium cereale]MEB2847601.1 heme ABC transporter permease [Endobacterium cereale]MQY47939.1 heme transporter HemC [Endobacterium cereale]
MPQIAVLTKLTDLANPTRFLGLASRILPWMAGITAILFAIGLYLSFAGEGDYQQGMTVRIMYVHVPAAWLSMMCYSVMAASAIGTLVWRHPLADVSHKAAAPLGAAFTLIALATGSLWGKPMWGTWWVWDARLTSVFVLFLMYLGLIALNRAMDDPGKAARVSSVLILVGFVNIPIIKFSVEWWNTLHQPASVIRMGGSTIDSTFLWPLLMMAIAFTMLFFTLHIAAMRNEIWRRRVSAQRRMAARMAGQKTDNTVEKGA